jgi:hypothetical protein
VYSEARQERGRRTVDKQGPTQREAEWQAFQRLGRTAFACSAEARQALETCKHGLQAPRVAGATIRAVTHYGKRGRPTPGARFSLPQGPAVPRGLVVLRIPVIVAT